jgi:tetratricopeptide (TPR) repeat protein
VRWLVNAHILLARVRNKEGEFRDALENLLPEAIKEAEENEKGKLDDRLVLAYIVKSESHLGLKQYGEAIEALKMAQKVNDKASGKDKDVGSERNKGWIFLNFAETHLRRGELGTSKFYLDQWRELRGIKYKWLLDFAHAIEQEHTAADFVVSRDVADLSWEKRKDELARWLIELAKRQTNSDDPKILAEKLKVTTITLGQLQSPRNKQSGSPRKRRPKKNERAKRNDP